MCWFLWQQVSSDWMRSDFVTILCLHSGEMCYWSVVLPIEETSTKNQRRIFACFGYNNLSGIPQINKSDCNNHCIYILIERRWLAEHIKLSVINSILLELNTFLQRRYIKGKGSLILAKLPRIITWLCNSPQLHSSSFSLLWLIIFCKNSRQLFLVKKLHKPAAHCLTSTKQHPGKLATSWWT